MAVRLRLSRIGKKNDPIYRIIAIDSRKMRDGMYLENLGTYNPKTGAYIQFHVERIEEWFKKGALPTDSVNKIYKRFKSQQGTIKAVPVQPEMAPVVEPVVEQVASDKVE